MGPVEEGAGTMADRAPAPQTSGDAHEDLLATLAASRELGPEMDKALAESYMQKHGQPAPAAPQQPGQPVRPNPGYAGLAAIGPVLGIVAYIAILALSGGRLWWMFWLPMALGGWWGGWWGHGWWGGDPWHAQRDEMRYRRRMARDEYRAWRRGYGYPPAPYDDPRRPGDYPGYPTPPADPRQQAQAPNPPVPPAPPTPPAAPSREVL